MKMKKDYKFLSIIGVSIVLIIGLLLVTTGALDTNSRFYGEWKIVDNVESMNTIESLCAVPPVDNIYVTFEPDGGLQITFKLDGYPVATIYGTYTIMSDIQVYMTVSGETSDPFRYDFSNRNMVLTLTDEVSGSSLILNKIQDL